MMIWVDGRVAPDDSLAVSILDRTFEHGLGLFETMRTWNGQAPLLDRHLARLRRSSQALGVPLDPARLPDAAAVSALLEGAGIDGDAVLRLTLTGGLSESAGSVVWMRATPLPPPLLAPGRGAVVDYGPWRVERDDPLLRHKTLNYWRRRAAYQQAREHGFDEVLSLSDGPVFWEGSRTNLFLVAEGRVSTPALSGPIVPGVMRAFVCDLVKTGASIVHEVDELDLAVFEEAEEVFLTNSVRGVIPVARVGEMSWDAPGPVTSLIERSATRLLKEGESLR